MHYLVLSQIGLRCDGVFSDANSLQNIKNVAAERNAVLEVLTAQRRLGNDVQQFQGNGFRIKDFLPMLSEDYHFKLEAKEVRQHLLRLQADGKIHWRAAKGGKNGCTATYELGPNPNREMIDEIGVKFRVK